MPSPNEKRWPVILAAFTLAVAAIYIVFRSAYWFPDALRWDLAVAVDGAAAIWHPHRLVYNGLAVAVLAALKAFGYGGRLVGAMEVMDALFGAAGVLIAYATFRRLGAPRRVAFAGTAAVAFSYGYWAFACNAESVTPAAAAAMGAFLAAVWAGESSQTRRWAAAGVVAGLAVLFHISNLALAFFLVVAALTSRRGRVAANVAAALSALIVVAAAAYAVAAAGVLGLRDFSAAGRWFFGSPEHAGFYMSFSPRNLLLDAFALGRNVVAIRWMKDVAAGGWDAASVAAAASAAALLTLATLLVGAAAVAAIRRDRDRRRIWLPLAYFLPYAVYFTFRDAGGWDRWVPQTYALWLFAYGGVASAPAWARRAAYLLPVGLLVFNFAAGIHPESKPANNEHVAYAAFVKTFARPGDLVVNAGAAGLGAGVYTEYFAGVETTSFHLASLDAAAFRARVAATLAAGRRVYVGEGRAVLSSTTLVSPRLEDDYGVDSPRARELLAGYELVPFTVYRGRGYLPSRFWWVRAAPAS